MIGKWLAIITAAVIAILGMLAGYGLIHGEGGGPDDDGFMADDASEIAASFSADYSGFFGEDFYLNDVVTKSEAGDYYPNGAAGNGSDTNYVTFYVLNSHNAAKNRYDTSKASYESQIGKTVMGSKIAGTYQKAKLDDAVGYFNNFNADVPSTYLYYTGYYGNVLFESYFFLRGAQTTDYEVYVLASEIYKAITNPQPVSNAKTYVEPVYEIQPVTISGTVPIFGNADNNLYIDQRDVGAIQAIASGVLAWDPVAMPYADSNNDGKVDAADADLVKKIINKEKCTVYYRDYYNEVEAVHFPLVNRNIAVTYYQQAEACNILGLMDNVKCASLAAAGQYCTLYPHLATLTDNQKFGTTGSSTINDDAVEKMVANGVNLVVSTPSSGNHDPTMKLREDRGIDTINLWYNGDYCFSTLMTMGILTDRVEKVENYMEYCNEVIEYLTDRISDSDKIDALLVDSYYTSSGKYSIIASEANGSFTMINKYLANLYSADDASQFGFANRDIEWLLVNQSNYDAIIVVPTPCGFRDLRVDGVYQTGDYFSRADYNAAVETQFSYLDKTDAYKNGNLIVSSYDNTFGYSTYAMLPVIAAQMYPSLFDLDDGLDLLQRWFNEVNVADVEVRTQGAYTYTGTNYKTSYDNQLAPTGGFYSWSPRVVEVNGDYSNCTPAFMDIAQGVFESIYGKMPDWTGVTRESIPSKYLYPYSPYVTANGDGTLTVKTFDNTSLGTSEAYADKVVKFIPTKILCYTDAYVDTIYMILCDYYGEVAHSGNTPKATAKLWDLMDAVPSSVKSGLESKYGLTVPSSVEIIGGSQEDLVNYCGKLSSSEKLIVFMSEYNIRSTNKSSWWPNNTAIEANSDNVEFIYLLSNSPAMVLSTIEMIGKVIGYDNTDSMMTSILAKIYVIQDAIDKSGKTRTFYVEMANGNAVGSNTLMGGIFASVLKMDNVFDGSLMGSKMSDEDIVKSQPQVIGFYKSDTRTMAQKMRAE